MHNESDFEQTKVDLSALLPQWGMNETTDIRLLTVSENATYLAHDHDASVKVILRVHRPDYHTYEEIQSELSWLNALCRSDVVRAPAPIKLIDGGYIATVGEGEEARFVVAFEFLKGKEPDATDNLKDGFETLGAISAQLHRHAINWMRPSEFVRKSWTYETALGSTPLWGSWRHALGLIPEDALVLEQLCEVLESKLEIYGDGPDRFGLIHADLRLANLLIKENSLSVIDFDDCGFSWFMYDFASAISFLEEEAYIPSLQEAWLKGYRSVRALSEEHENMIPTFVMFRRLLLTAWVASHRETDTAKEAGLERFTQGTVRLAKCYLATECTTLTAQEPV